MKCPIFFLIAAIGSFGFGAMMFFAPSKGAQLLGLAITPELASLLRGMGGLIIGRGTMNLLFRNSMDPASIKALF